MNLQKGYTHKTYRYIACLLMAVIMATAGIPPMALAADNGQPRRVISPPPPAMPSSVHRGPSDVQLHTPKLEFTAKPTDLNISTARIFSEPLIPMSGRALPGENEALARALLSFKSKGGAEDISDITSFLAAYPKSRWRPSLELNIGQSRFEAGYLTDALIYWQSAWDKAKNEKGLTQASVANGAISRLLVLEARLGRMSDIKRHLSELKNRPLHGSDETRVRSAKEGLATMTYHPDVAFKCGPYAINSILYGKKQATALHPLLLKAASTTRGTNLWQLKLWAAQVGLNYQPAKRLPHASLILPCIMHWKVDHFAAMTAESSKQYELKDPTFDAAGSRWMSARAIESQSDGYFLVPAGKLPAGWQPVDKRTAESIWGKGNALARDMDAMTVNCPKIPPAPPGTCGGMAQVAIFSMQVTANIVDIPLSYSPPVGPAMSFRVNYNYLENNQPSSFTFTNLGHDWSFNWGSYLSLDSSKNATVRVRGGGSEIYTNTGTVGSPAYANPNVTSQASLAIVGGNYQRQLPDGSIELFNDTDGTGRIFMTRYFDPQGNSVSIQYDSNFRITSITDAIGQVSTLTYGSNTVGASGFYNVTQISDPFGRTASFSYDSSYTYLLSITDQIGLVSKFAYDTNSNFITQMTTPYGSTSLYQYTPVRPGSYYPVGLRMNFPDGTSAVAESWAGEQSETFYWDRHAMALYPNDAADSVNPVYSSTWHCAVTQWQFENITPTTLAPVANWYQPALVQTGTDAKSSYTYAGSTFTGDRDHYWVGTTNKPASIQQNTSTWQYQYNSFGHVTQAIDPSGRTFSYTYASNNIDLTQVKQTRGGNSDIIGQWIYNQFPAGTTGAPVQHLPLAYIDGSGQKTAFSYNSFGQLTQRADAGGNVWTYSYGGAGGNPLPVYLTAIDGPLSGNQDVTTFTYDGYGRVYTATDSEGYTLTYSYDNADRITQITYPDGTFEQNVYDRLDLVLHTDRLGRSTQHAYDNMDQLAYEIDPLCRKTQYAWCSCGSITCLTDPAGHATNWEHDLEGRVVGKTYADGTQYSYAYNTYGLLQNRTDALNQTTNYLYNGDLSLSQVSYVRAVNPTSTVSLQYDPNYPRLTSSQNGSSALSYAYNPYFTTGTGIATITLGGTPTTGNVINVTVGSTTGTNISFSGTPTTGNVINVLVLNNSLSGGKHNVQYTVQSSDTTLGILASSLAGAVNADTTLSGAHISAASSGSIVYMSAYSTAGAFAIVPSTNGTVTETVGGTIHAGDIVTVSVYDSGIPQNVASALPTGQRTYAYTVGAGDSTANIAHQLQLAISADTTLSGLGITASWTTGNSYFTIASSSVNQTQYAQAVDPAGNETITLSGGPSETAPTAIVAASPTTVSYTVQSTDTSLTILAASIKNAINANTTLSNAGVAATSNSSYGVVYLTAPTQFSIPSVTVGATGSPSPTETITTSLAGNIFFAGTPATGDRVNVKVMSSALTGGSYNLQYKVLSTDTSASVLASSVAAAINSDPALSAAGIAATANGSIVSLTAPASAGTVSLASSTNGTITETITFSGNPGDTFQITAYDAGLPAGQKTESYTASTSDTATTIASALTGMLNTDMTGAGISAISSSGVISISSVSVNGTIYRQSVTGSSTISQGGGPGETAVSASAYGAGRLHATANSAINNSITTYIYDPLGRTTNRSINGPSNSSTWAYDQISRVTSETNPLGGFGYSYVNNTSGSSKGDPRLASISYPNGQTTNFSWLPNIMDQRLQQLVNLSSSSSAMSQFNYAYDQAGQIRQWQQQQNGANTHYDLGYDQAGQLTSAQSDAGSSFSAYISGTVHAGDVVSVTAYDASLTGTSPPGQETASYTVTGGDTATTIASQLASNIASAMSNINVTTSASGSVTTINTSPSYCTSFTAEVSGTGATDTIALSQSQAIQPLHSQLYYTYDCAGNRIGVQGDSTGSFPTGLTTNATKSSYNCVNELVSTSAGGPVAFQATTVNPVKSAVVNVSQAATIGGSILAGDVLYISAHDPQLSSAVDISYTVANGDTLSSIASSFASAINANTTLSTLGVSATSLGAVVTISSSSTTRTTYSAATSSGAQETITLSGSLGSQSNFDWSRSFSASPVVAPGANTAKVTAVSGGGIATTNSYPVAITSVTSKAYSSDANGNLTNVLAGVYPQYSYDAENRLIQVAYDSNNSTNISYDAAGHFSQIAETYNGAVLSTNNLVWCRNQIGEARDANSNLVSQYFSLGQTNFTAGLGSEYYELNHLGSVVGVANGSGSEITSISYDPYGIPTVLNGRIMPDFGFAGYYLHQRSELDLTMFRAYGPTLGRWLSRDPLEEGAGTNLFCYVRNDPLNFVDPEGAQVQVLGNPGAWAAVWGAVVSAASISRWVQEHGPEVGRNIGDLISKMARERGTERVDKNEYNDEADLNCSGRGYSDAERKDCICKYLQGLYDFTKDPGEKCKIYTALKFAGCQSKRKRSK